MRKIIPFLENYWENEFAPCHIMRDSFYHKKVLIPRILEADQIVFLSPWPYKRFTHLIRLIRKDLKLKVPFIFHLHDLACTGLSPFIIGDTLQFLDQGDTFLGSCPGDDRLMRSYIQSPQSFILPFCEFVKSKQEANLNLKQMVHFFYLGRISESKGIHTTLTALARMSAPSRIWVRASVPNFNSFADMLIS